MNWKWTLPFLVQGFAMIFDEAYFHRRRGLSKWERLGHPIDTTLFLLCLIWTQAVVPSPSTIQIYIFLATLSTLAITKDEWVHKKECPPAELWIHSLLFILHPVALFIAYLSWTGTEKSSLIKIATLGTMSLLCYQIIYWSYWPRHRTDKDQPSGFINNEIYRQLGERWYVANNDPVALLRAESRIKVPWVRSVIESHLESRDPVPRSQSHSHSHSSGQPPRILDLGCGAGFLTNTLALQTSWEIHGLDSSPESLEVARR